MDIERLRHLFDEASELPANQRAAFLERTCADDPALRAELELLLRHHEAPDPIPAEPTPTEHPSIPQRVGPFELLEVLGTGGSGVVYRARQLDPDRIVAVKLLQPGILDPGALQRLTLESQALARLQHPGIAQVFATGSADTGLGEVPYLAMELIEGVRLDVYADSRDLDIAARCALIEQLCDAVQHAHDRGILHRDLKPANVLVAEPNPGDAQVKVLDFGIARPLDDSLGVAHAMTSTGQLLGTLPYMSPEQLGGVQLGGAQLDGRSDVYAIGVLLHELLVGERPLALDGLPLTQVVEAVTETEPQRIGRRDPRLRGDLETIVHTALAKDPAARYPSARALADDLRRLARDQPIVARPLTRLYQLRKFVHRHRTLVGGVVTTLLSLLLGMVGVAWLAWDNSRLAEQERLAAGRERNSRYFAEMNLAGLSLTTGRGYGRIRELVDAWQPTGGATPLDDPRGWEWHLLRTASTGASRVLQADEILYDIAWLDEHRLATQQLDAVVRDVDSGAELLRVAAIAGPVVRFIQSEPSPDGALIAIGNADRLEVYDARTGAFAQRLETPPVNGSIVWIPRSADRQLVLVDTTSTVWSLDPPEQVHTLGEHVQQIAFTPDGRRYALARRGGGIEVGDVDGWQSTQRIDTGTVGMFHLAFSHDGGLLAGTGSGGEALVWDLADAARLVKRLPHDGHGRCVAWSRDAQRLAVCSREHEVLLWDRGPDTVRKLSGHSNTVLGAAFSPFDDRLATASEDRTIRIWEDLGDPAVRRRTIPFGTSAEESGSTPVSLLPDGALYVNDLAGKPFTVRPDGGIAPQQMLGLHRSLDGSTEAGWYHDRTAGLDVVAVHRRADATTERWPIPAESGSLVAMFGGLRTSDDGSRLVFTTRSPDSYSIWTWIPFTGADPVRISGEGPRSTAISTDGSLVAVALPRGVLLLDADHGTLRASFPAESPESLAFHPDQPVLAIGRKSGSIDLWSYAADRATRQLQGHTHLVRALAWRPTSADGPPRLASGSDDRTVRIWDPVAGRGALTLLHEASVFAVAWNLEGSALVSVTDDGEATVWDASPR